MPERSQLRRQERTLASEGRLSGYILFGMPLLLGTGLFLFRAFPLPPYANGNTVGDGVDATDKPFEAAFPYTPLPDPGSDTH